MYVELIFLDNFIMNALIMYLSARFTALNIKIWRIAAACAFGALYAVFALALLTDLQNIIVKIAISLIMCFIAFGRKCLKQVIALYVISFIFSGACLALGLTIEGSIAFPTPAYRYVLGGALICIILVEWIIRLRAHSDTYDIEFTYGDKVIKLSAMYDTGNGLKDPISGKGIIVAEKDAILKQADIDISSGVRCFMCNTVSGKTMLYALKPDTLLLKARGKEYTANSYIALTNKPIGGGYNALVGVYTKLHKRGTRKC